MTVLGLCAGVGGLELGLHLHGHTPIGFVERDKFCQTILRKNWDVPVYSDVFGNDYLHLRPDILTAGFPCQPVSTAGLMKGESDERWIFPRIAEVIRVVRPAFVFLENVPNICRYLSSVLGPLAEMGFDAEWGVFSCGALGAPHKRERWFCLAHANGVDPKQSKLITWGESQVVPAQCLQGLAQSYDQEQGGYPNGVRTGGDGVEDARHPQTQGASPRLANPNCARPQAGGNHPLQCAAAVGGRPLWPPDRDPNSWEGWQHAYPSERRLRNPAQSRVRGELDGFPGEPFRAVYGHQVRALGNAVSPPVAAFAWETLGRRLL